MIESPAPLFQLLYILEMKITFLKFLIESIRKVRRLTSMRYMRLLGLLSRSSP